MEGAAGRMDAYETANTMSGTVHGYVVQGHNVELHVPSGAQPATPHQVRKPRPVFVNREGELSALVAALGRAADGGPAVVAFTGLGGVGKTELIAQFVHRYGVHFPDGDLYADLAAHRHDGEVDLGAVLGGFLRAFAVERVPDTLEERAALYRTVTAERHVLLFLDNVERAAEVRTLFPSAGLVVVAGRRRLPGLRLDGAEVLDLAPLGTTAGAALVRRWLGPERGSEQELRELVEQCGGLPLALNAVGFQLLDRGRLGVGQVLAELSDRERGLSSFSNEEGGVDGVLDSVYRRLPRTTRELYHLIGVNPGPLVSAELAAAAGIEQVDQGLAELRSAHLLDDVVDEGPDEHYRAHDLVRRHAYERVRELPERSGLFARVVEYYRGRAFLADVAVLGSRLRLQEPAGEGLPAFTSGAAALDWLRTERANLREVVRAAGEQGRHGDVWRLCESLWPLYHGGKHYDDWVETHRLGVDSAQRDERPDAVVRMRNQLARAHYELRDFPRAIEQLVAASELVPLVVDPRLVGVLHETEGLLCLADGRPERAVELFTLARAENEGDAHGVVVQGYNLAQALIAVGRPEQAVAVLDEATELAEAEDDGPMLMRLALVGACARRALGLLDEAAALAAEAGRRALALGQRLKEAEALRLLVTLAEESGDSGLAERSRSRLGELGDEEAHIGRGGT
ncbi:regulator [Kitasatospora hibisci]|uniref:regulator n=1 Tax=Kitasatospora hibisci TaxID=3369522 RepID=UPI003754C022